MSDISASAEEQETRKRRLLRGPSEFREVRKDREEAMKKMSSGKTINAARAEGVFKPPPPKAEIERACAGKGRIRQNSWKAEDGAFSSGRTVNAQVKRTSFVVSTTFRLLQELTRGLPVAKSAIIDFADKRVLSIERFDRLWTKDGQLLRVPQEDCCQALSIVPSRKYESDGGPGISAIINQLNGSDTPEADQRTFFKAQIVFWLLGATDWHTKNFSLRSHQQRDFR